MLGGDRGGRLAALGAVLTVGFLLAILTAMAIGWDLGGHQQEAYPRYKTAAQNQLGPNAASGLHVETPEYKQPCRDPESHDESDLCAQYRAADNAGSAARWAFWQLWFSIFGVVGLGITIAFTIRATNAAVRSNEIAQDTAKRQLRAYVVASTFKLDGAFIDGKPRVSFVLRNTGQTPAYEVRALAQTFVARGETVNASKVRFHGRKTEISKGVIGTGGIIGFRVPLSISLRGELLDDIRKGDVEVGVFGVVSYRDAFRRRRLATFKRFLDPADLKTVGKARLSICAKGNKAN